MVLRRWDPLQDILSLQDRMNRLFEESLVPGRLEPAGASGAWVPVADLYETGDTFVAQLELPGVDEKDVEVRVDRHRLTVRGARRPASRGNSFLRMERSYGPFSRTFELTQAVDGDKARAEMRDGILRLELPKVRTRDRRTEDDA